MASVALVHEIGRRPAMYALRAGAALTALAAGYVLTSRAQAATLQVGPGQAYSRPSAAIAAAHEGDTVLIAPGTYYDCAIVSRNGLTIAGAGVGVVLTDRPCAGKALLVVNGHDITIRNMTLARVRVPDGNGAGIRAEGHNLTVDHVSFINDQDGILAAADQDGTITVRDSTFRDIGGCDPRCGHGIAVGRLKRLRVVDSIFQEPSGGDHIFSAASTTELIGNRLTDDAQRMTGPMVFVSGGILEFLNNTVLIPTNAKAWPGAAVITGDAIRIEVRGNILHEAVEQDVPLLRNWTGQTALATGNTVPPGTVAVSDNGETYHRLRAHLAVLRDSLRAAAGTFKHLLAAVVRRLI